MKKISQMFIIVCLVLLNVQLVSAAEKPWIDPTFDFSKAHRILILKPNYTVDTGGATSEEVTDMLYQEAKQLNMYPLNMSDIDKNVLRDSAIDLPKLRGDDPKKAEGVFNNEALKYTDLYMVATIVHNNRVMIFYDVYSMKTKQLVYTYKSVAGSSAGDTIATYQELTKSFYKEFNKINKR